MQQHTRDAHRHVRRLTHGDEDDITEIGREAIHAVATVGTVNAATSLMGMTLGSFPKP